MEPASLMTVTPSCDWKEELGTGGNLGTCIPRGGNTHEDAPGTGGTGAGLMSVATLSMGASGPGGGVGQGSSAEVIPALARMTRIKERTVPVVAREMPLLHLRLIYSIGKAIGVESDGQRAFKFRTH